MDQNIPHLFKSYDYFVGENAAVPKFLIAIFEITCSPI